ncbi:MAG TPA: hypothetical protein VM096_00050 [Vicinamibacterales bacterium]|nr:hypothetical protein [Vicinamibacterales bacterium]
MMIDNLVALLMGIPPMLAGGWGAWFVAGLLLSLWTRREKNRLVVHDHSYDYAPVQSKHKSGPVEVAVAVERPPRPAKKAPHSTGDAFGDLAALLEPQGGSHRMPGEAAVDTQEVPVLAAPRSLP